MKKGLSLLLALSLLLSLFSASLAEEEDLEIEEIVEEVDLDEEAYQLTETDKAELAQLGNSLDSFAFEPYNVDAASLELNPNLPDSTINILLLGLDSRDDDLEDGGNRNSVKHADVQIILSLNPEDQEHPIKLSSILRDTLVEVPTASGYKKTKITNSYGTYDSNKVFHDSPERTMRTINHNFEMNVQYYVSVNFYGVVAIIDAMGGVDIDLKEGEAYHINKYIEKNGSKMLKTYDTKDRRTARQTLEVKAGVQHLDGLQALMYARIRESLKKKYNEEINGDWGRTARTRHLLDVLLQKVMSGDSGISVFDLFSECLDYVSSNMNVETMFSLVSQVLSSGILEQLSSEGSSLIDQFRIPMDTNKAGKRSWTYATVDDQSVVFMNKSNFQENVEALHEFIYGSYIPAAAAAE